MAGAPRPKANALDIKVVIVGAPRWYYTFFSVDPDFHAYFKVKAGIDADMDATSENVASYAGLIGTNLFDALRIGQVDAAMLQEPALSLITANGGRELVNFMELEEARTHLGGAYEFMGVSVRAAERDQRQEEIQRLGRALAAGLAETRTLPPAEIVASLPSELVAGGDVAQLEQIIDRYRLSLYPETVTIDVDAARRVVRAQEIAGLLEPGQVDLGTLLDTAALQG